MKGHPKKENPVKVTNPEMGLTYYEKVAPKGRIDLPQISYSDYVRLQTEKRKPFDLALSQSEILMDYLMRSVTKRVAPNSTPDIILLDNPNHISVGSVEIPDALTLNPENWLSKQRKVLISSIDSDKENHDGERKRIKQAALLENTSELCDVVRKLVSDADDNDENKMKDSRGRFFTIDLGRAFQYDYKSAEKMAIELPRLYVDTFEDNDIQDFSKKKYQDAIDHVMQLDVGATVAEIEKKTEKFLETNEMKMSDLLFNFKGECIRFSSPKQLAYSIGHELIESKKRLDVYNHGLKKITDVDKVIDGASIETLEELDEAPEFMLAAHIKHSMFAKILPKISMTDKILQEHFAKELPKDLDKSR